MAPLVNPENPNNNIPPTLPKSKKKRVYPKRPIYRLSKLDMPQYQTLLETYPEKSERFREVICQICHQPFYLNSNHKFKDNQNNCSYKCRFTTTRKESINGEYFKELTEANIPHLGHIFAVTSIEFGHVDYIHMYSLNKSILEYAQSFISNDSPIKVYKDYSSNSASTETGWHIRIKSVYLLKSLLEYGINIGDMYMQNIPNIPPSLYPGFIQGFLQGCDQVEVCAEDGILAYKRYLILSGELLHWIRDHQTELLKMDQDECSENIIECWEDYIDGRFWLCVGRRVRIVKKRGYLEEYYDLPDGWDI